MKKILLIAALLILANDVLAQGQVILRNRISGTIVAPVYRADLANPTVRVSGNASAGTPTGSADYGTRATVFGAGFTAQLWGGASGITDMNLLQAAGNGTFSFTTHSSGSFSGQIRNGQLNETTEISTITGVAPGAFATLQLRVWDNRGGTITSWAQAVAAGDVEMGYSDLFASPQLGGPNSGGGVDFVPDVTANLRSFNLTVVPEPTTWAMLGLGAGALMLIRRRK